MRLISLELNGFKSFAQKTKIEFMPGMTGIVGPNGSGKSNIIEAIRWVMGEQSAKDLRGNKMADVIFAGSDTRKPLNRAEVAITFDNQDHYLNSDYSEIKITRKLYRTGESQYLINGQECRLKDVLDLFMDSGLGRESFSIISQGRVEAIFNGKPTDRRAVIEEVAGVAKYKKNKTTAEKRLADTTDNLHRVGDIISELETQLEPLAQESALAKEFQEQKKQFDQLDRTKTVLDIEAYQAQTKTIEQEQHRLDQMTHDYDKKVKAAESTLVKLKQSQTQLTQRKDLLQNQLLEQTKKIADLNNLLSLSSERSSQQKINLGQLKQQRTQLEQNKEEALQELANIQATYSTQQAEINAMQEQVAKAEQITAEQQAQLLTDQIEALQNQQIDQMQALTTVHNQRTFLTRNHEQDSKRQVQSQTELKTIQAQFDELKIALTQQQQQRNTLNAELADKRKQLNTELNQRQSLKNDYDVTQKKWYQALGNVQSLETRQTSLKSLETEYSGFYQGVRTVLQQRQQFNGLMGPVAELINVPAQYTTAIETVLGAQLQNLVVDNQTTGQAIISYLTRNRGGRATILPIDSLAHHTPNQIILDRISNMDGFLGLASELVTIQPEQQIIVDHLLSNTIVADNLSHATRISKQTQHRFRIVTTDGQLINASGAMTGGANRQQRQGLLSRQNEVEQLETKLVAARSNVSDLEATIQKLDQATQANNQVIAQLQTSVTDLTNQFQTADGKLKVLTDRQKLNERQLKALSFEVGQQDGSTSSYEDQLRTNENKAQEIEQTIETLKQKIVATKQQLNVTQLDDSKRQESLQQKKQWLAVAQEKIRQTNQQKKQLQINIHTIDAQLDELNSKANMASESQEKREQEKARATQSLQQLKNAQIESQTNLELVTQKLDTQTTQIETASHDLDRLRELQRATLNDLDEVHAKNAKLSAQLDHGFNRLSENYAMTFEEAKQNLSSMSPQQINTQLKLLKRGLDEIGPVNLGSIEEYDRVNKRYSFLHDQQTDLLSAKQQLNDTMQEMDQEVETRFYESYQQVATSFSHIFAQMFGGGQAQLVLTDPDNLLTTGIDIIAQPPGKKNQQMSLLSGGEKALTAITLLFAILEVRPVPFAILDETEAALDEANVNRFARYLSTYGDNGPQFIVVTHRKGTMMNANVLYGVTMQESGVSKMVSVSLEDVPI